MIRGNDRILTQIYALVDFILIESVFLFAWWLKFRSGYIPNMDFLPFRTYAFWDLVYGIIAVLTGYMIGFYSSRRKQRFSLVVFKIFQVHFISLLLLISILFIMKEVHISRSFLALFTVINIIVLSIYRYIIRILLMYFRTKGYNKQFLLIIGAGNLGRRFYNNLLQYPELGFEVRGFLDDYQINKEVERITSKPILGEINDLDKVLSSQLIDEVIIALPLDAHQKIGDIISSCEKAGVKTLIIPDYFDYLPAKPSFDHFAGIPLINVRDIPLDNLGNRIAKRSFDIIFSLIAILILSPVLLLIAIGVKVTSPGPIIFKQERVGLNRRTFKMYKFRSMRVLTQGVSDTQWTTQNDPRKTKFGAFLRKTSLDELPQFFNVLLGHMSVVGPRPERPFFVEQFKEEIPKYMVKHHIRPGITGWAQASGLRGDTSIEERIKHDIFYIENWSFFFDVRIIFKTIVNGFINKNAY